MNAKNELECKDDVSTYPDGQLVLFALDVDDLDLEVDSDGGGDLVRSKEDAVDEAHEERTLSSATASDE